MYITTHNRKTQLRRAILSVLNQSHPDIEIIVVDDGSTDGTEQSINDLINDNKIIYLKNEASKGACFARNLAIDKASGYYITGLDDDDEFLSNRVNEFISEWHDDYSFICANFYEIFSDGRKKKHYPRKKSFDASVNDILYDNICSNQVFTRTDYLRSIGGFDVRAKRFQDWDTWLRLANAKGKFHCSNKATYIMYHDHVDVNNRVSKKYPLNLALKDLKERNSNLYEGDKSKYIDFMVNLIENKASFFDVAYWSILRKQPNLILSFFKNKIVG